MDALSPSAVSPSSILENSIGSNSNHVFLAKSAPFPLQAYNLTFQLHLSLLTLMPPETATLSLPVKQRALPNSRVSVPVPSSLARMLSFILVPHFLV